MRPTRGVVAALVGAFVLHQLAGITGGGWLALGSGALLALPVAAVLLRPRLAGLQVTTTPVRTRVGRSVEVELTVRNPGRRPSPPVRLTDTTPGLAPLTVAVPALAPGGQAGARLIRVATSRASSTKGTAELSSSAPFGLVSVRRSLSVAGPFVVAPAPTGAPELLAGGSGGGELSTAVAGSGPEVLGLRPFRAGDTPRAVHARASARQGRPVVLERERETGPAVVLLCLGPGAGEEWERAVAVSCALAEQALQAGRPPRLLAGGLAAPVRPGLAAVLDWHAGLDAARPLDPATLAQAVRAAGRGGALVLLAPPAATKRVGDVRRACAAAGVHASLLGASR